jgi:hypothetical protein
MVRVMIRMRVGPRVIGYVLRMRVGIAVRVFGSLPVLYF